ncbi:facilitated trehalose transporter Tret1-like isoform X2 [Cimex lectularius]|nr:facilitated trehalose transporter Tret1-like isoform X2 [Cimex lectularius]
MCFAWVGPMTPYLLSCNHNYNISSDGISWLVSIIELGALVAPIPSGMLADRFGRKPVLLAIPVFFLLSWFVYLWCENTVLLMIGRVLQGIGLGVTFTIVPIYIAEIAEPNIRGRLTGHIQTLWYLGILISYVASLNLDLPYYSLLCIVVSIINIILLITIKETPYYFLMKSQDLKASDVMSRIRPLEKVNSDLKELKPAVEDEMKRKGFIQLFKTEKDRKALWIVLLVNAIRYLTGMPSMINYATDTFGTSPKLPMSKETLTILLGVLLTCVALMSAYLSDIVGRRSLLLISGTGCFISHFFLGLYFYIVEKDYSTLPHSLLFVGLIGFCVFSDIGLAPISQILQAEMFPSNTRGIGGGVASSFASVASFVNLITYEPVTRAFGVYMNYWIYATISLVGTVLINFSIKETAGKTLHQINLELNSNEIVSKKNGTETKP